MKNRPFDKNRIIGSHYLIDLFACNRQQINSVKFLRKVFTDAVKGTDISILKSFFYEFDPQGVTGFFLLSSSHMSVHSWPEHEYISIDIYSCSDDKMTRKLVNYITNKIRHQRMIIKNIDRTYDLLSDGDKNKKILKLPIYKNDTFQTIHIEKWIANIKSVFQQIEVVDTKKFGRCLLIDKIVQTSEKDHHIYDEAILSGLSSGDNEIIILGGGDGYAAEKALSINSNLKITIVDLDAEVIFASKKYLGQKVFDHPNVNVYIGDALQYLKTRVGGKVDGIISDLTDNPMISLEGAFEDDYSKFFDNLISLSKNHLKPNGWVSMQAGTSKVSKKYLNTAKILNKIAKMHFAKVSQKNVLIPSFGEENCFILAKK